MPKVQVNTVSLELTVYELKTLRDVLDDWRELESGIEEFDRRHDMIADVKKIASKISEIRRSA